MKMKSSKKSHSYAIMIPTKGRSDRIQKGFKKMPFLDSNKVYVGIEHREIDSYKPFMEENPSVNYVFYHNPEGSVSFARQQLKCSADLSSNADTYVFTDDNAVYSKESLHTLLNAYRDFSEHSGLCVMAGAHSTSEHFDRNRRKLMESHGSTSSYPQPAMIFY